ncbi:sulfite exporter TauE/SafE family protein [Rhodobacter sp. Har01]|uniref:sulfite exporter TauE/SafE family protein n=1 Tax=Rhodobacter sp. Har01 TaxID=2883999 RepID=UPI001D07D3CD|nr:sulfite exporter TauE/SafE family protein [Rhodobacter sp. Har01]MCB6178591.1 sulfite exporter TauE/SafE family protein [Rhodobacter sp. Har01]
MSLLDPATLLPLIAALTLAGALIGFLAGLFGIGGGAISVPVFYQVFQTLGHAPDVAMPLAVGTSLAVIIPTSIQSSRGHFKRGTVDMGLLRLWALPVLAGVALGSAVARFAPPQVFQIVFVVVAAINAAKLLSGGSGWRLRDSLPGKTALRAYGAGVGLVSALMGIGGGAVSNLILTLHNVPIHRAVSTSAGVGVLIAVPGTLGYMIAGLGRPDLPPDAIGFVSVATFLLTIPTSILTTRFGVALAHRLSRKHLETAFGLFLLAVCLRFLWAILAA